MRNCLLSILAMIVTASCAFGQGGDSARVAVIWGADGTCDQANTKAIKDANPTCSKVEHEGATFFIVTFNGVSYAMTYRPMRDFVVTSIQVSNNASDPLKFAPLRSQMGVFRSTPDLANGQKSLASTQALSANKLRVTKYAPDLSPEIEGPIRPGLQVTGNIDKTVNSKGQVTGKTVNLDPKENPADAPQGGHMNTEYLVPKDIFAYVLGSKTLAKGEKAAGHVVFKKPEPGLFFVFTMNAGDIDFIFPVGEPLPTIKTDKP